MSKPRIARLLIAAFLLPAALSAQRPPPAAPAALAAPERVTFRDAVDRALQRNPTIAEASADILRADALLRQARAVIFPQAAGSLATTVSTPIVEFNGVETSPRA